MNSVFSFQADSSIVQDTYQHEDNYLIEYDKDSCKTDCCVIYFSSNGIYYPNNEYTFINRIIKRNAFEWYGTRIDAYKHIFLRDVKKQFYLHGINAKINTPEQVIRFLLEETKGYRVVTIGSSAGGYASLFYGSKLKAETIWAFNPIMDLHYVLKTETEETAPIVHRWKNTDNMKFYDLSQIIEFDESQYVYYLFSRFSIQDWYYYKKCKQHMLPENFHAIELLSHVHGVPIKKSALKVLINRNNDSLCRYDSCPHIPLLFSIRLLGIKGIISVLLHNNK